MSVQCPCNVCTVFVQCLYSDCTATVSDCTNVSVMSVQYLRIVCTRSAQCLYSVCAETVSVVRCLCNVCAVSMSVQSLYNVSAVSVQCLYSFCTISVQWLHVMNHNFIDVKRNPEQFSGWELNSNAEQTHGVILHVDQANNENQAKNETLYLKKLHTPDQLRQRPLC